MGSEMCIRDSCLTWLRRVIHRREHRNEPQASLPTYCFNCNPSNSLYAEITGCSACHSSIDPAKMAVGTIPPQLTADDARRVADVRRDVWTAGLRGAVAGVFIGSTGWLGARHLNLLPKAFRTPNHFSLATMGCGALVSFLSSLAAGKNSVQRIGDVFSRGAVKPDAERRPVSALQLARANAFTDDIAARRRGRAHALSHGDDEARHGFAPKPPDS